MGQALCPAHFLANMPNTQYLGQTLTAEEEQLAKIWASTRHPFLPQCLANCNELQSKG